MFKGDERFRVYNRCRYDIGVTLMNGIGLNIPAGSFQMLSTNDIMFIESICTKRKYFSAKMLVPVDDTGKDVDLTEFGLYPDAMSEIHMTVTEIENMLNMPIKKMEAVFAKIEDRTELDAIKDCAKKMDLPASKLKILATKIPYMLEDLQE